MIRLRLLSIIFLVITNGIVGIMFADAKRCDASDIKVTSENKCSTNEYCDGETNTCQCQLGFKRKNDTYCEKQSRTPDSNINYSSLVENQGNGSLVAGILIPIFLILFVIFSVYVSRKYELLNWIRNKLNRRDRNYDEFMIGQDDDDPPLA